MTLHLIQSPISHQLRECVNDLHDGVRTGEITGLGVVVLLRGRRFFVDVVGQLSASPHEARGMVAELDDELRDLGHRRRDSTTTM